jgi:hypothetical protein
MDPALKELMNPALEGFLVLRHGGGAPIDEQMYWEYAFVKYVWAARSCAENVRERGPLRSAS